MERMILMGNLENLSWFVSNGDGCDNSPTFTSHRCWRRDLNSCCPAAVCDFVTLTPRFTLLRLPARAGVECGLAGASICPRPLRMGHSAPALATSPIADSPPPATAGSNHSQEPFIGSPQKLSRSRGTRSFALKLIRDLPTFDAETMLGNEHCRASARAGSEEVV
jgi:hypothetical protein